MPDLLQIYHTLPYRLRVIVASVRGVQLGFTRYGPQTNRLMQEALARETWSVEQWQSWQSIQLAEMLNHAAVHVPYYRQHWQTRRRHGNRAAWDVLENWPVLSKDALRDNLSAFVADGVNRRLTVPEHTSGTTGKPLTLWLSVKAVRQWYVLFEARWRGWYGLSRHDRWGIFGGQLVTPYQQSRPPFWVWNAGLNQVYFSSYHLAPGNIPAYLEAIRRHRLVYLLGYASSLYSLAQLALEQNLPPLPLKAVLSNAEPLYLHQRETIARAFACPVYDTYGLSENVCAASECASGHLHLWPEVGWTEILAEQADTPVPAGVTGRIVCTGLLNFAMPLIRYEVGDLGELAPDAGRCSCGRGLPILRQIEGRLDDVILTPDGRRIGRLDPIFKADLPIREAQIIQEKLDRLRIRYIPATGFAQHHLDSIARQLRERVGNIELIFERVEALPRTANGKFRAVISKLDSPV